MLLTGLADKLSLLRFAGLPEGVQATVRSGENGSFLFLLNLSKAEQTVKLDKDYRCELTGAVRSGQVVLAPNSVEILGTEG
ncbi:hypothetical protein D3C74_465280 [compost metagenome]